MAIPFHSHDVCLLAETVKITVGSQVVCELHSGGAICLPKTPAVAVKVQSSDASNNIAVECLLVT